MVEMLNAALASTPFYLMIFTFVYYHAFYIFVNNIFPEKY